MISSFGRRQDCNALFFGRRYIANYYVDAGQKVAQKLECNCNSPAILKVIKQSYYCFPSQLLVLIHP